MVLKGLCIHSFAQQHVEQNYGRIALGVIVLSSCLVMSFSAILCGGSGNSLPYI
jgi:hypothetical protein